MTSIDEVLTTPNIDNLNKIGESISILESHIVKLTQIRADYEDSGLYSISEVGQFAARILIFTHLHIHL